MVRSVLGKIDGRKSWRVLMKELLWWRRGVEDHRRACHGGCGRGIESLWEGDSEGNAKTRITQTELDANATTKENNYSCTDTLWTVGALKYSQAKRKNTQKKSTYRHRCDPSLRKCDDECTCQEHSGCSRDGIGGFQTKSRLESYIL